MNPSEILDHLAGLRESTAPLDLSPSERALVQELFEFLEKRRVMYHPAALEVPEHCVSSVFVICDTLTGYISQVNRASAVGEALCGMRGACRKFLSAVQADRGRKVSYPVHPGHYGRWVFDTALGELRAVVGVHLARLAVRFQLPMSDELSAILPGRDNDEPI